MNLEKKLNVAINFQFLFLDEQLINRSCSKWRKYQEGRTQAQKCPVGEGREEGNGLRWGSIVLVQATCYPTQVSWKQRCHLELQIGHYRDGDQGWVLSLLNRRSNIKTKKFPTFFAESREIVLALIFFRIMYIWLWVPPASYYFDNTHGFSRAFLPAFFIKVVFRTNLLSVVDGQVSLCWICSLYIYVGPFSMASLRSSYLSQEGFEWIWAA